MKRRVRLHVVRGPKGWVIVQGGQTRPLASVNTQERAIEIAKGVAKEGRGEVRVHGKDGRIRLSFSGDQSPPKGSGWTRSRDAKTGSFTTPRSAERIRATSVRAADVLKRLAKR